MGFMSYYPRQKNAFDYHGRTWIDAVGMHLTDRLLALSGNKGE